MLNDYANVQKKYVWTSAIVFVILAIAAKAQMGILQTIDNGIISVIQGGMEVWLTLVMKMITHIADTKLGFVYALLIAVYLWFRSKQRVDAIWILATMVGGSAIAFVVKEFVKRARPTLDQVLPETGFSFPSGHTFEAFLILSFIFLFFIRPLPETIFKRWMFAALVIWQVLVMWSRVYLGAHYPSDVIAAVALGVIWLWVAIWLYHRFYELVASFVNPAVGRHQQGRSSRR